MIDHVCIKKALTEEFFTNANVENIYFSGHDAVRTVIEKNSVDFHTTLSVNFEISKIFRNFLTEEINNRRKFNR